MKTWIAAAELLVATLIWGFGFTATIWAQHSFDTITLTLSRFTICFVVTSAIIFFQPSTRPFLNRRYLRMSFWPGIFLGITLLLQTWGLEYTSATNSSFITTLYVVFVPLIELLIFKHKLRQLHFVWVTIALVGTGLMVNLQLGQFNSGDVLTLACSVTAALQIVLIGRQSQQIESPLAYNAFQSLWAAVAAALFIPFYPHCYFRTLDWRAALGTFSLIFGSTLLGFFLQVKAQKTLSSSLSSLLFLLESPFALLFAVLLLNERITLLQALGGLLIFLAAFGATRLARPKTLTKIDTAL